MRQALTLFVLLSLVGCGERSSSRILIPEERFADLYVALLEHTPEADSSADSSSAVLAVLSGQGVTEYQFRRTVKYYSEDTERWRIFYRRVIARLEDRRKREREDSTHPRRHSPAEPSSG